MRNHFILIPAAALVLAIAPLPYGYYTLLRLLIFVSAIALAWQDYNENERLSGWVAVFGILAIVFNPIIPVYLNREVWFFIDIVAAAIFGARWYTSSR